MYPVCTEPTGAGSRQPGRSSAPFTGDGSRLRLRTPFTGDGHRNR